MKRVLSGDIWSGLHWLILASSLVGVATVRKAVFSQGSSFRGHLERFTSAHFGVKSRRCGDCEKSSLRGLIKLIHERGERDGVTGVENAKTPVTGLSKTPWFLGLFRRWQFIHHPGVTCQKRD